MGDTFALDIGAFVAKANGNVEEVVQKTGADILAHVVDRSPVGKRELWAVNIERKARGLPPVPVGYVGGRYRGNWNVSFGTPDLTQTPVRDQTGGPTISRGITVLAGWKDGATIFIMNSLPYGPPLEYSAHSSQAPAGMVRVTVAEFHSYIANNVAGLPK